MNIKSNLRKITELGIGLVSTFANTVAGFITPTYIASDSTNLYVTDLNANNIRNNACRAIAPLLR